MQRTDPKHGFARVRTPFVIFAVAPASALPGESSLHDPALRQHSKTFDSGLACFHFQFPARPIRRQPVAEVVIVVLVVPEEFLHAWVIVDIESIHHLRSCSTIVENCGRDHHRQQQSHCIHQNMAFSAIDLLAAIIAMLTASLCRLDRLAINAGSAGRRFPARFDPHLHTQSVHHALPGSIVTPGSEVVVDRALGQQIMRQQVPLAPGAIEVDDRVDYLSHVHPPRPTSALGRGNERFQNRPLFVGEIRRIRLPCRSLHAYTPLYGQANIML